MKYKKIVAALAALSLMCQCAFAQGINDTEVPVAEVTFSDGMTKNGSIASATMATSANIMVNDRGGRKGWLLNSASDTSGSIRINLADGFAKGNSDGTEYVVEVDYLDADKSVFNIIYDSMTSATKETKCVYLGTSQEWTTARFTLDDALFSDRLYGGYDLCVTVRSKSIRFSSGNVLIGGVRVYKYKAKNPVRISGIKSSELGNIFGNAQDKKFDVEYTNYSNEEKTFTVNYTAADSGKATVSEAKETMTLAPKEVRTVSVPVGGDRYGLYNFAVSLAGNGFSHSDEVPYSYINNCTDGSKNKDFGYNIHWDWAGYDPYEGIEVIKKSNAGFVRKSFAWAAVDPTNAGKYSFRFTKECQDIVDALKDSGVELNLLLCYGNTKYEGTHNQSIPVTDEGKAAFVQYTDFIVRQLQASNLPVRSYEIWNEPNIKSFNKGGASATQYGELALMTAKKIRELDPDSEIGVMSITDMAGGATEDFFRDVLDIKDIGKYVDAIAIHPYSHGVAPEIGHVESTVKFKNIFKEKMGFEPIVNYSELGYHSNSAITGTTFRQAIVNVRNYIMYNAQGLTGAFAFYDFSRDGSNDAYNEANYGHVETAIPDAAKVNYAARENFIADANMNKVLMNARIHKKISETDGVYAYIFRRADDGGLAMPLWYTGQSPRIFSFKCSAPSLKLIDIYGNEETVYGKDGVYSLMIGEAVQYIEGDIDDVALCDNPIEFDKTKFDVAAGSVLTVSPTKCTGGLSARLSLPANMGDLSGAAALETGAEYRFRICNEPGVITSAKLNVYDGDAQDGKLAFVYEFPVETTEKIGTSVTASPINIDDLTRWQLNFNIDNKSVGAPVRSGKIVVTEPKEIAGAMGEINFDTIPEFSRAVVNAATGKVPRMAVYPLKYTVYTDDGRRYDYSKKLDFTVACYAKQKPKIDAVAENGEWNKTTVLYSDTQQQVYLSAGYTWNGTDDLSAKTMIQYDEDNIYLFLDVTDDIHSAGDKDSYIWRNDSVQFGTTFEQRDHDVFVGGTFTEISFGDTPDGPIVWRHGSEDNAFPQGKVESAQIAFRRDGSHSYYEVSVPWSEITAKDIDFDSLKSIGFSMLVNDNDGAGRKGWIEYGSGIGKTKDTSLFTFLNVIK